jgi:ferrous iron transport protein A
MRPGQRGVVVAIQAGLGATRRLDAMGIRPGVVLKKVSGQLFGGPVVVQAGNLRIAIGLGMARKVLVELDVQGDRA